MSKNREARHNDTRSALSCPARPPIYPQNRLSQNNKKYPNMLTDLTVKEFLNKVAGSDPVPGGGSIAALNGAVASALAAMVANLTIGKKKYEEVQNDMQAIAPKAEGEKDIFTTDIDRDSEAYDRVFSCFKMPKDTDEQKAARSAAIQEATKYAAQVPMEVARRAYALMPLIAEVALKGNQNAVTDACVAMMSARRRITQRAHQPWLTEGQRFCQQYAG